MKIEVVLNENSVVSVVQRGRKHTRVKLKNGSTVQVCTEKLMDLMMDRVCAKRENDEVVKKLSIGFPNDLVQAQTLLREQTCHLVNSSLAYQVSSLAGWSYQQVNFYLIYRLAMCGFWADFSTGNYSYQLDQSRFRQLVRNLLLDKYKRLLNTGKLRDSYTCPYLRWAGMLKVCLLMNTGWLIRYIDMVWMRINIFLRLL